MRNLKWAPFVLLRMVWIYRLLASGFFLAEVLIATLGQHVPWVRGSLGDVLVMPLVYFGILSMINIPRMRLAGMVLGLGCFVEGLQAIHIADQLGLSRHSFWRIVIGNTFGWDDLMMYGLGCLLACLMDQLISARTGIPPRY